MLNTPLTDLRRRAPRLMTYANLVVYFERRGLPRTIGVFGNFERGEIKTPSERFLQLWAAAVGADGEAVRDALARTRRQRARQTGPFAHRKRPARRSG